MEDGPPVFPPELERHIFEICALGRPVLVPKLMLVAWRVKEWIEPFLYRTILLGESSARDGYPSFTLQSLLSTIRAKPPGFLADAVRSLSLNPSTAGYEEILSACTGLENLRMFAIDSTISTHTLSTLKHLYVFDFPYQFQFQSHSVFSQLTHLDVMGTPDLERDIDDAVDDFYSSVLQMPRLTHISFSDDGYASIFLRLLQSCPHIQVFFYYDARKYDTVPLPDQESLVEDPRFVVLRFKDLPEIWNWVDDWHTGVHCGRDYWYRAERFIRKRRAGEIDRRQCFMSNEEWVSCA